MATAAIPQTFLKQEAPRGFFSEFGQMVKRIYDPSHAPLRLRAFIDDSKSIGLIGRDRWLGLQKNIRTLKNEQLVLDEKAFYVRLNIQDDVEGIPIAIRVIEYVLRHLKAIFVKTLPKPNISYGCLPSTLLREVREGQTVEFCYEGRPIELTLRKEKNQQDFQTVFNNFENAIDRKINHPKQNPYLCQIDVPEDVLVIGERKFNQDCVAYLITAASKTITGTQLTKAICDKFAFSQPPKKGQLNDAPYKRNDHITFGFFVESFHREVIVIADRDNFFISTKTEYSEPDRTYFEVDNLRSFLSENEEIDMNALQVQQINHIDSSSQRHCKIEVKFKVIRTKT